jgi:hypothetical protein
MLQVVITLIVIGFALYLVNRSIPMADNIKALLNIFVAVVVCVWLLNILGVWDYLNSAPMPRLHR